jgi:hypothetical protein
VDSFDGKLLLLFPERSWQIFAVEGSRARRQRRKSSRRAGGPKRMRRIIVAVSFVPQYRPHGMREPGGRPPRLGFGGRCHVVSLAVGRCSAAALFEPGWGVWPVLAPESQKNCSWGPPGRAAPYTLTPRFGLTRRCPPAAGMRALAVSALVSTAPLRARMNLLRTKKVRSNHVNFNFPTDAPGQAVVTCEK